MELVDLGHEKYGSLVTRSLRISNVYGHGFDRSQQARLEALGFEFRAEVSTFAGSQLCSFLDFARGPALELIEIEDDRQYLDFVLPGMEPYCPGISLVATDGAAVALTELEREFEELDPYTLHVGYHGGDDPAAPGWRYLNFARPVAPGTFAWFTSFDEPRPVRSYTTAHPNGVVGAVGLVFDLPACDLRLLGELAGASRGEDSLRIGELDVWTAAVAAELPTVGAKVFPLTAVVLAAPSLDGFGRDPEVVEISFRSEPAVLVRLSPRSWDLVIRRG